MEFKEIRRWKQRQLKAANIADSHVGKFKRLLRSNTDCIFSIRRLDVVLFSNRSVLR